MPPLPQDITLHPATAGDPVVGVADPSFISTLVNEYKNLTAPIHPSVEEFAAEHPVAGVPARFAASAGSALLATPEQIYEMVRHPVNTAESTAKQVKGAYEFWKHPDWKGALSVLPEALGQATGTVAGQTGMAKGAGELGSAITDKLRSVPELSRASIAERAAPHVVAAGNEMRGDLNTALKSAEQRVDPLYNNLERADQEYIAKNHLQGSVDVRPAISALEKSRSALYGSAPTPNLIGRTEAALQSFAPGNVDFADLKTARMLRRDLTDDIGVAVKRGDRPLAATLMKARGELTDAMAKHAQENLGLGRDFKLADQKWGAIQDIREKTAPLRLEDDSAKLFADYRKASPETRVALDQLQKYGLVSKAKLESLSRYVERIEKGEHPGFVPWRVRLGGYAGMGLLLYQLQQMGLVPKTPLDFMYRYVLGMGGAEVLANLIKRMRANEAIGKLPNLPEGTSLGEESPTAPNIRELPPASIPAARSTTHTPYTPPSEAERLRGMVPLELRPVPGEEPLLNMLMRLEEELKGNPQGVNLEGQLARELAKLTEKSRRLAREREAMRHYRK